MLNVYTVNFLTFFSFEIIFGICLRLFVCAVCLMFITNNKLIIWWDKDICVWQLNEKLRTAHPNLTVYKKEDIPERYHFRKHYRIPPLLLLADEGYAIVWVSNNCNSQLLVSSWKKFHRRKEEIWLREIFLFKPAVQKWTALRGMQSVLVEITTTGKLTRFFCESPNC